jgi:hypothetical protein
LVIVKELRRSSRISRAGRRAAMAGRGGVWSLLRNSGEAAENAARRAGIAVREGVGYW